MSAITVLTGANTFLLQDRLQTSVSRFTAEYTDMAVERCDGEETDYEHMRAAVESLPFLTERKLVLLREPGKQKLFAERIEDFIAAISDTTDVLIVEPKLDKRLGYYKTLKKLTRLEEFGEQDANGLARWARDYAQGLGGSLDMAGARLLVDRLGASQQLVATELDKLVLFNPNVTQESIELLVESTPQSTIFELIEAAVAGKAARVQQLYDEQRQLKVEPQQIIAMLTWQLHILAIVVTAGDRSPDAIAKDAKLSPFVVRKSVAAARHLSVRKAGELIAQLTLLDRRLKREVLDADEALRHYLLLLSAS